ncbi:MAG: hypothetical protein Q8N92_08435, partial [Erysipelotrichaceae bacterium]|nr:hypothetical protein [Erysipelotrichaceae bacterium]
MHNVNDEFFNRYMEVLVDCLKIPTIHQPETVNERQPYGQRVAQGYQWAKSLGEKLGFNIIETPGHALAWVLGEGKDRVETVSHMDV